MTVVLPVFGAVFAAEVVVVHQLDAPLADEVAELEVLARRPAALAASDRWTDTLERRPLPHGHWALTTHPDVIAEVAATRITERGATRADDRVSEAAMEDRKKEGYF